VITLSLARLFPQRTPELVPRRSLRTMPVLAPAERMRMYFVLRGLRSMLVTIPRRVWEEVDHGR